MEYKRCFYEKYVKRFMDLLISIFAIVILSPVLLVIAALVAVKLGRPVIFAQKRPGLDEKIFTMYKFRSMTNECDRNGDLLPDKIRLTKFGKKLRATSLDELPELFNILKGNMSVVGPRPQLVRDMVFMNEKERLRHAVRPGLTGLAQVSGRNGVAWEEKLKYDLEYVKNVNLKLDIKIFIKTIKKVMKQEGISAEGMETAEDLGDYLLRNKLINEEEYAIKQTEAKELLLKGKYNR